MFKIGSHKTGSVINENVNSFLTLYSMMFYCLDGQNSQRNGMFASVLTPVALASLAVMVAAGAPTLVSLSFSCMIANECGTFSYKYCMRFYTQFYTTPSRLFFQAKVFLVLILFGNFLRRCTIKLYKKILGTLC